MRDLLKSIFRRTGASAGAGLAMPPPDGGRGDAPVYAIGDIHGRSDLLIELLQMVEADAAPFGGRPLTVFLGDYIDRGDHSRDVLDCLTVMEAEGEAELVFLRGNHEQMMLDFLEEPERAGRWLRFGGLATLMSYGLRGIGGTIGAEMLPELRARLADALDPGHIELIERMPLWHLSGNLLFVHAGADPVKAPDQQEPNVLMWGCPGFGKVLRQDGIWVVHGHTIVETARASRGIISVDTGAYVTGRLTAVRIHGGEVTFLST